MTMAIEIENILSISPFFIVVLTGLLVYFIAEIFVSL
jgi:hypothetical protein